MGHDRAVTVPEGTRSTLERSTLLYFAAVRADPDAEIDHEAIRRKPLTS